MKGIVSSRMIKFLSTPTNTMSGRAEVIRMFGGTVVGGLSVALNPSRSPYNFPWSARCCCRNNMILFSTLSCRQVYLPWERETGQALRMWSVVGVGEWQRLQLLSVLYLQRARFIGVGSGSDAALRIKESWPAGKPFIILDQTFVSLSSSHTSVNFFWAVSLCKWLFQCSLFILAWMALVDLGKVTLFIFLMEPTASWRASQADTGMFTSRVKAGEEERVAISSITGSFDTVTADR